jgi:hypothetical protein
VARLRGQPELRGAEFRIAAACPAVTVVLVAAFWLVALGAGRFGWPDGVRGLFDYLARINLLVLGFNSSRRCRWTAGGCCGRGCGGASGASWPRPARRRGRARPSACCWSRSGCWGFYRGRAGGIWFAFLGWFLIQAAQSEALLALARQALGDRRVRDLMTPEPVVVAPDRTVAQFVEEAGGNRRFSSYPVVDQGRLVGVVPLAAHVLDQMK